MVLALRRPAVRARQASNALARAIVAELHALARGHGRPGPNRAMRDALVLRLLNDSNQVVYGLGCVRRSVRQLCGCVAANAGDRLSGLS